MLTFLTLLIFHNWKEYHVIERWVQPVVLRTISAAGFNNTFCVIDPITILLLWRVNSHEYRHLVINTGDSIWGNEYTYVKPLDGAAVPQDAGKRECFEISKHEIVLTDKVTDSILYR